MLTKSELKTIFAQHDFKPLKRFGENYLIDGNIKDKIIAEANIAGSDAVLEIGPGLGALTMDLAKSGAKVWAVEKDRKAFAILDELMGGDHPNLKLVLSDVLEFDIASISPGARLKVIGNLPYYITTPILEYLIEWRALISSILIVVQREFAERILAIPGTKGCSSISTFIHYHLKPSYLFTIKPTAFFPEPDVDSSLIRLDVLDRPPVTVKDEALFFKVVRGAFHQKRKTIANSLSHESVLNIPKDKLSAILAKAGVDSHARPETLSLQQFASIANTIE